MSSATKTKKVVDLWKFYLKDELGFAAPTWSVSRVLEMMRTGGTREVEFVKTKTRNDDFIDVRMVGECFDGTATVVVRLQRDDCSDEEIDRLQDIACVLFPKGSGQNFMVRERVAKAMGRLIRNEPKNDV